MIEAKRETSDSASVGSVATVVQRTEQRQAIKAWRLRSDPDQPVRIMMWGDGLVRLENGWAIDVSPAQARHLAEILMRAAD